MVGGGGGLVPSIVQKLVDVIMNTYIKVQHLSE
jgi:hypothetical protein